ncbi:hypothetical protein EVAR_54872_1 [Eumeta japonica]|uniref:Uncharacterized protein n=1 Tax=Eumeta variegata TaxID=151549 RepID=A0A4C1YFK6_EUMVA|nr:hypothetical protein EVAR_54872_1 [Eumeta japonica]
MRVQVVHFWIFYSSFYISSLAFLWFHYLCGTRGRVWARLGSGPPKRVARFREAPGPLRQTEACTSRADLERPVKPRPTVSAGDNKTSRCQSKMLALYGEAEIQTFLFSISSFFLRKRYSNALRLDGGRRFIQNRDDSRTNQDHTYSRDSCFFSTSSLSLISSWQERSALMVSPGGKRACNAVRVNELPMKPIDEDRPSVNGWKRNRPRARRTSAAGGRGPRVNFTGINGYFLYCAAEINEPSPPAPRLSARPRTPTALVLSEPYSQMESKSITI